ncbi:hypothetical protein [Sphingomonas sp. PvP056]|uniref:hypothetical protein n=1 Tax=Sphingomonas sp. PvP056 TaxID=3156392 RepID=UPI003399AF41
MGEVDLAATLLQLSLVGITNMTDRVAILDKIEHDLRSRLRHLDLSADDLVTRPSDDDLASLAGEGMLGAAAAKLYAKVRAGEGGAALANRALERLFEVLLREPEAAAHHRQQLPQVPRAGHD